MSRFISIKPLDTLFFRGSKPFNMNNDSWSDSHFLPFPSVIWGSLYNQLYFKYEDAQKEENFKNLKIKNIFIYNFKDKSTYLTMPNDVFSDGKKLYIGEYKKAPEYSSYPLKYINYANCNEEVEIFKNSFIRIDSLSREYMKKDNNILYKKMDEILLSAHKVGISIDKSRNSTKDGHLYRIDLTQFCQDWGFLVEYDLDIFNFDDNGYLKLGGESKVAKFEHVSKNLYIKDFYKNIDSFKNRFINEKYFKIYFKTPTTFENGWKFTLEGCEMICANIDEYFSIGGYDMKNNEAKKMKRYIPNGVVYVFEKQKQSYKEIQNLIEEEIKKYNETHKGFGLFEILEA